MVKIHTNYGLEFDQIDQESILKSAETAGIILPYSCRDGRCSSCKCKVLSGDTKCLSAELGLSESQILDGWILSCVRAASTDVLLEVENLESRVLKKPRTLPCKIDTIEMMSKDIIKVILRIPSSAKIDYQAGQYVEIILGGIRRSYSIANAPCETNRLELHIKKVELGSMSEYWFDRAKKNDLLRLNGPLGTFFLRNVANLDLVFLATGTGIAPIKAILEELHNLPKEDEPASVTVFWGGRNVEDLYFDVTVCKFPIRYEPVLSRPSSSWSGAIGHVQDVLIGTSPDLTKTVIYACGSEDMIRTSCEVLVAAGLDSKSFYSDAFVASGYL